MILIPLLTLIHWFIDLELIHWFIDLELIYRFIDSFDFIDDTLTGCRSCVLARIAISWAFSCPISLQSGVCGAKSGFRSLRRSATADAAAKCSAIIAARPARTNRGGWKAESRVELTTSASNAEALKRAMQEEGRVCGGLKTESCRIWWEWRRCGWIGKDRVETSVMIEGKEKKVSFFQDRFSFCLFIMDLFAVCLIHTLVVSYILWEMADCL